GGRHLTLSTVRGNGADAARLVWLPRGERQRARSGGPFRSGMVDAIRRRCDLRRGRGPAISGRPRTGAGAIEDAGGGGNDGRDALGGYRAIDRGGGRRGEWTGRLRRAKTGRHRPLDA